MLSGFKNRPICETSENREATFDFWGRTICGGEIILFLDDKKKKKVGVNYSNGKLWGKIYFSLKIFKSTVNSQTIERDFLAIKSNGKLSCTQHMTIFEGILIQFLKTNMFPPRRRRRRHIYHIFLLFRTKYP